MYRAPVRHAVRLDVPEEDRASLAPFPAFAEGRKFGLSPLIVFTEAKQERHNALPAFCHLPGIARRRCVEEIEMRQELLPRRLMQNCGRFHRTKGELRDLRDAGT
jgi:hypothetical protein